MTAAPIRIVAFDARYVNDRYQGIGRHAYNLLEALTRLDPDRRYLAFYHPDYPNTRFNMEMLRERPNVELRPIRLPLYLPREQLVWPLLLTQARADLFHTPYVVLPLLARIRLAMTVHDLIYELHPEYRPRNYLQRFYFPITHLGIKRADLAFTVTESSSREIQAYYHVNRERIHVIGNAVDPTFRRESDPARLAAVRECYGLPEHFILTVGAGRPYKNVETLVEAFARLDPSVGKTINSPLLTHKIAISLSLMRIYVLYFSDAYHCPSLKLTHKSALKSRLLKFINFSLKRFVICLFRRRYGSKWRAYESKLNLLNVNDLLTTRVNDVV